MNAKANMNWVTDDLATGGDLSLDPDIAMEQVEDIVAQGVTSIIDLRQEANDGQLWSCFGGMNYLWLGTDDANGHHIPATIFDQAVMEARRDAAKGGKTFVHCHMGVNRGPSVAYAVLLDRGMDAIDAYDLIRAKRTQAGLYYAMDALKAHQGRARDADSTAEAAGWRIRESIALRRHIAKTWTPDELKRIQHVIRDGHQHDADTFDRLRK